MCTPERRGPFVCLHALAQACQRAAGFVGDRTTLIDATRIAALFCGLPAPDSELELLAVERLLFRFAEELVRHLHARMHAHPSGVACGFGPQHYRLTLDSASCRRPATLEPRIKEWMQRVLADLRTTRPRSVATRARRRLQGSGAPATAGDLAAELGCSPALLRRQFTRECGEPLRRFRIRARVLRAIELLRTTDWKIEAIAREVGWRSKKDLYVQIKRATGMTPADLRRAPAGTIAVLTSAARIDSDSAAATN